MAYRGTFVFPNSCIVVILKMRGHTSKSDQPFSRYEFYLIFTHFDLKFTKSRFSALFVVLKVIELSQ